MSDKSTLRLTPPRAHSGPRESGLEPQALEDLAFAEGDLIDSKFRLEHRLGEGGMSSVWLATDLGLDRKVALKLLGRTLVSDDTWRKRFSSEARNMARIHHDNVVQVHSFGAHHGWPYFVMDLIDGVTLTDWRRARQDPEIRDVVMLVRQMADGLDAIHRAGLIHRDVKPANVMVDRSGHVTILDLGLSSLVATSPGLDDGAGTPSYMAPEQVPGAGVPRELAARADIYQLGITTFELLVGGVPFEGDSATSVQRRHRAEAPPPPSHVRPGIPEAIDRAVLTALAKDPADRYASASEFARALELAAESVRPRAPTAPRTYSILVAEDEPGELSATCALLAAGLPEGSEVQGVADGAAALELAERHDFDALVLDLHMPGLGGLQVVERLAAAGKPRPYTLVVTASGGAEEWRSLRQRGVNGILLKPFEGDDLVSMIRRHVA